LGFLSIITRAGASCVLSEKVLDMVGLSIDAVKIARSRLSFLLFSFIIFIFFSI